MDCLLPTCLPIACFCHCLLSLVVQPQDYELALKSFRKAQEIVASASAAKEGQKVKPSSLFIALGKEVGNVWAINIIDIDNSNRV